MVGWRRRLVALRTEVHALYLACRHPATPWYARILAACVVGYAFSPIDLIPDFIPVVGHLDDILLVPLGVFLAIKLIPRSVMVESRQRAEMLLSSDRPRSWVAGTIIAMIWVSVVVLVGWLSLRLAGSYLAM